LRSRLVDLAGGPSDAENALTQQLIDSQKEEMRVRQLAGRQPLSDKYISGSIDQCELVLELAEIIDEAKELEAIVAKSSGSGLSREDYKLRRLAERKATLERQILPLKRLYA